MPAEAIRPLPAPCPLCGLQDTDRHGGQCPNGACPYPRDSATIRRDAQVVPLSAVQGQVLREGSRRRAS